MYHMHHSTSLDKTARPNGAKIARDAGACTAVRIRIVERTPKSCDRRSQSGMCTRISFGRQSAFDVGGNHIKHDSGSVYADEAHARGGAFAARMLSRGDVFFCVQLTCTNS